VRPRHALLASIALALVAGACHGGGSVPSLPQRDCARTVWYQPTSASSHVELIGSWNGWARPGQSFDAQSGGWVATRVGDLAPGPAEYALVVDGQWLLDPNVATSAFHDGQEVSWIQVPDCSVPATRVDAVTADPGGTASIDATFLSARAGDPIDPASVTLETVHGATPSAVTPSATPSTGAVHLDLAGLPAGKSTLAVHAKDAAGRDAQAALATVWTEPATFDWRDAVIYEVMVDRFRAKDGTPLAPPASMGDRAGGHLGGVQRALESGELTGLGVNTLWLTPLYANPPGEWPGADGHSYTGYHGYWPSAPRSLAPELAAEADVDALVAAAHARGVRVLFDVVPHHVHTQHPYWVNDHASGWFQDVDGTCVCGTASCPWSTEEMACWFTPYLPSLDWTNDDVATTVSGDVLWWMQRFDGDGVRIDAVPMMPRAAARRIAWAARDAFDGPSHRSFVLGENFTGQGGYGALRYDLGPQGLDGEFHFPLMWALRGALGQDAETLLDVEATIRAGEAAWSGSGAVMGLILDNHDTSRFSSVAAGNDGGDPWQSAPQPTDANVYARTQLALGALLTLPGAPVLYYGDEVALAGRGDPDARRVMPAEADLGPLQTQTRDRVKALGRARACLGSLRRGTYRTLAVDAERLVFARELPGADTAIVVLQRSPAADLSAPLPGIDAGTWVDVLSGGSQSLRPELTTLPAAPLSMALYVPASSVCAHP
jgi:glycosidase